MNEHDPLFGALIDNKYQIDKLLGRGGMGSVYRAVHLGTRRTVAIKLINPQFSLNEEFVERFRREAEAAGRLRHPNIVDVTDFGFARINNKSTAYLVMEYLDGETLAEVLNEEGKLPLTWVVDILEQVCSAVDEAHNLGIIHRDLKPDNIWLEPNRLGGFTVKVLDFGLVKMNFSGPPELKASLNYSAEGSQKSIDILAEDSATLIKPGDSAREAATQIKEPAASISGPISGENKYSLKGTVPAERISNGQIKRPENVTRSLNTVELTRLGSVMGTPLYMSPEQCRGEHLEATSDIYSLGVIAYRMLTGETPFTGTTQDLLKLHQTSAPPPIRERNSKVPGKTVEIIMSALSKNPERRPQSAAGFAGALRVSIEGSNYLLRSAVSLYSEHFPAFFKISLIAYAPLIVTVLITVLTDKLGYSNPFRSIILFAAMFVTNLLAYFIVSAATVPVVVQLALAPLRPVRLNTAFSILLKRWPAFVLSSVIVTALILFGTILFIVPGIIAAMSFVLYAPVVVIENKGPLSALKRARQLMKRNLQTGLIITILQFALPILVLYLAVTTSFNLTLADDWSPKEFGFSFSMSALSSTYQLLNIFVSPLTAIMTALLYLKTRRAGGESLKDTARQLDEFGIGGKGTQV